MVAGAEEMAEVRRGYLAALGRELEARGLEWRLLGAEGSVLQAAHAGTGRRVMVLATVSAVSGQAGWFYLWSGGGMADTGAPAAAADEIARALGNA